MIFGTHDQTSYVLKRQRRQHRGEKRMYKEPFVKSVLSLLRCIDWTKVG